jgi:hypothetical protein
MTVSSDNEALPRESIIDTPDGAGLEAELSDLGVADTLVSVGANPPRSRRPRPRRAYWVFRGKVRADIDHVLVLFGLPAGRVFC